MKFNSNNDLNIQSWLQNLGFGQNFFSTINPKVYTIKKCKMKKIFSESAVVSLPVPDFTNLLEKRKSLEEEDVALYKEAEGKWNTNEESEGNSTRIIHQETNLFGDILESRQSEELDLKIFQNCSRDQIKQLNKIFDEMNSSPEETHIVRAYKSKLKTKFYSVYERNSKAFLEEVKFKLFLKCNFPGCNRTFSSSGWLKAHFSDHLKELKRNKFNILFERLVKTMQDQPATRRD